MNVVYCDHVDRNDDVWSVRKRREEIELMRRTSIEREKERGGS